MSWQFQSVLLVDKGDNLFRHQLLEQGIRFHTVREEKDLGRLQNNPDLVIVVNMGVKTGEVYKQKHFPSAQVVVCQGGAKAFSPIFIVVWGEGENNHDYHQFGNWGQFFSLVGSPLPRQTKILRQRAEVPDLFAINKRAAREQCGGEYEVGLKNRRRESFRQMLSVGQQYLAWYREWLQEVGKKRFFCHFGWSGNEKRKVYLLAVPNREWFYQHEGMPIFSLEGRAVFWDNQGGYYPAVIVGIDEDKITFRLEKSLSRRRASGLTYFYRDIDTRLIEKYQVICEGLKNPELGMIPLRVLSGGEPNKIKPWLVSSVQLGPEERKILRDKSQCLALARILSGEPVTWVEGIGGSGKTFIQALATKQLWRAGRVILVTSHSNKGLDVLTQAIARSIGKENQGCIFRLGNNRLVISKGVLPFHRSERFEGGHEDEVVAIQKLMNSGHGLVLACTLNSLLFDDTWLALQALNVGPEISFVDEATRGFIYELAYVYALTKIKVVNVGDHRQLSDVPLSRETVSALVVSGCEPEAVRSFNDGLFKAFLAEGLMSSQFLKVCRRSLPKLIEIFNIFYDGLISPGRFEEDNEGRVIVFDLKEAQDRDNKKQGNSWCNHREANVLIEQVKRWLKKGFGFERIGIITPYQAQIRLLKIKIRKLLIFGLGLKQEEVDDGRLTDCINTVDAFQGGEREVIFLSTVRSNEEGDIGFNDREERMVVSFTRARDTLIIFINSATFLNSQASGKTKKAILKAIEIAKNGGTYHLVK